MVRDSDSEDQKFIREAFQAVISTIELYKVEFDTYPESFMDPELIKIMKAQTPYFSLFSYLKHEVGYEVNVLDEDHLNLKLPDHFWTGLGICKTNISNFPRGEIGAFNQDSNQ